MLLGCFRYPFSSYSGITGPRSSRLFHTWFIFAEASSARCSQDCSSFNSKLSVSVCFCPNFHGHLELALAPESAHARSCSCSLCRERLVSTQLILLSSRLVSGRKACPWAAMNYSKSLLEQYLFFLQFRLYYMHSFSNFGHLDQDCRTNSMTFDLVAVLRIHLSTASYSKLFLYSMQAVLNLGSSMVLSPLVVLACTVISSLFHPRRSSISSTAAHHFWSSAVISWPLGFDYSLMDFDLLWVHHHLICKVLIWWAAVACLETCCWVNSFAVLLLLLGLWIVWVSFRYFCCLFHFSERYWGYGLVESLWNLVGLR